MLFNSHVFVLAFLPIVLAGFLLLVTHGGNRAVVAWLLSASLFFYAWWNPLYLPLLLTSIVVNYALGCAIERLRTGRPGTIRWVVAIGVVFNLGLLGFFKYAGFVAETLNWVTDTSLHMQVVLPLAISFFTFQQIAYLVEVGRGHPAETRPLRYGLFVAFFPQLIAGPIVRDREMLPQLDRFAIDPSNLAVGIFIFAVGLAKKVIIADGVAPAANAVFGAAEAGVALSFAEAWTGALAYTVQIYFDFSGYSDMAVGLARLFGIHLPINFNSPYKATSIIDFWRRWHMTLSRFLRDYLYIPLGGGRVGRVRRYGNLMITMLLGGLWHGAGWTFVVWGGLHGLYLVANHAWAALALRLGVAPSRPRALAGLVLTFTAVVFAWVFFRAESFAGAAAMLAGMTAAGPALAALGSFLDGAVGPFGLLDLLYPNVILGLQPVIALPMIAGGLAIAFLAPNVYEITAPRYAVRDDWRQALGHLLTWRPTWRWGMVTGAVLAVGILGMGAQNEFLYFNF